MRIGGFLIGVLTATAALSVVLDVPQLAGVRNIVSGFAERTVALSREAARVDRADSGAGSGSLDRAVASETSLAQGDVEQLPQRAAEKQPERVQSAPEAMLNGQAVIGEVSRSEGDGIAEADVPAVGSAQLSQGQPQGEVDVTGDIEEYLADAADAEIPVIPHEELPSDPPAQAFPTTADEDSGAADLPLDAEPSEPQWQIFWSPFRSTRSATGFAERLTTVTGLEITVLEERRGRHYVAFAYADELQRDARYALIEHSTGLQITRQGR